METNPVLIIGGLEGTERTIALAESAVAIGRAATNDIVLSDAKASRVHARLEIIDARWTLIDLGSTNGTLLNAHGRGAIHRDIKPANILFTGQDEPVLVDFGIARLLGDASQLTAPGQIIGSPAYMAPEQARGEEVDARCDQYALGVVLYEMATGRTPFQGDSPTALLLQHVNNLPPPQRAINPNLPEAIEAVLLKALAKEPEQRFPTTGELAAAFRSALAGETTVEEAPVSPEAATILDLPAARPVRDEPIQPAPPGPSEPAAGGDRWLTGLLKVASVFAPLVGQEAAPVDRTPQERRSRLAAGMGAVGILLASLQLLINALDLVSRPAAMIGRVLPYLIVILLLGGALLSGRIVLRTRSPRRRRQAAAFLLLILLVGLGWGGVTAYNWLRPPADFLVLTGDFDGASASRQGDFAQRIGAELISELREAGDIATVERSLETYKDSEAARAARRKRKAAMVIWGSYDDFGVTPRVELLRQPLPHEERTLPQLVLNAAGPGAAEAATPSRLIDFSHLTRTPLGSTDLDLFAAHGPDQMTYVVSAILAAGLYAEGQYRMTSPARPRLMKRRWIWTRPTRTPGMCWPAYAVFRMTWRAQPRPRNKPWPWNRRWRRRSGC